MKRLLTVAILATAIAANAQNNARISAMGGVYNINDITNINSNPANALSYKDNVQLTITGYQAPVDVVNPLYGIKSIGHGMILGVFYVPYRVYSQDLYTQIAAWNGGIPITTIDSAIMPIPHVLAGFGGGGINIAADLYFERGLNTVKNSDDNAAGTTKVTTTRLFNLPGVKLGLSFANIPISVAAGVGIPKAHYKTVTSPAGAASTTSENIATGVKSSLNFEAKPKIQDATITAGLNMGLIRYHDEDKPAGGPNTKTSTFNHDTVSAYVGVDRISPKVNALFSLLVDGGISHDGFTPVADTIAKLDTNTIFVDIRAGAEKTWVPEFIKFFDNASVRAGLDYNISRAIDHNVIKQASADPAVGTVFKHNEVTHNATNRSYVNPTFGAGIGKGVVSFDVVIAPLALRNVFKEINGVSTADDFVEATLSLDMGKAKK